MPGGLCLRPALEIAQHHDTPKTGRQSIDFLVDDSLEIVAIIMGMNSFRSQRRCRSLVGATA